AAYTFSGVVPIRHTPEHTRPGLRHHGIALQHIEKMEFIYWLCGIGTIRCASSATRLVPRTVAAIAIAGESNQGASASARPAPASWSMTPQLGAGPGNPRPT